MSSVRVLSPKHQGCLRKKGYNTKEHADRIAEERTKAAGHEIHSYYCEFCKIYHIGRVEPCLEPSHSV